MKNLILAVALIGLTGCATKSYPIAPHLTSQEVAAMDCHDMALASAQVEGYRSKIAQTERFNLLSVGSFLGDFGVGNVIANSHADNAATDRSHALHAAARDTGCVNGNVIGYAPRRTSYNNTRTGRSVYH